MTLDRNEALRRLREAHWVAPDGSEECSTGYFEPADAAGVARLFYTVYGEGYPVDTCYIPERLIEENRSGALHSVVARTDSGEVVAHVALYRSSPRNAKLYEYGLGLTLPSYRSSLVFSRACQAAMKLVGGDDIDGFFCESVCNHVVTQKLALQSRAVETALEPALMPAAAYTAERSAAGRVACVMSFRVARDQRRVVFVPPPYRAEIEFMMSGLGLDRELRVAESTLLTLPDAPSAIDVERFASAGVARCTLTSAGNDLAIRIGEVERELAQAGYALVQVFVDLGQPSCGAAVDALRAQGYSLGGFLPTWFGNDGLLLHKYFAPPDFDHIQLHSARAKALREIVERDWRRAHG
jgi:hypothetical protein